MPHRKPLQGRRILVIEDDPDQRANLIDLLEMEGHHVDFAGNAHEALAERDWPRYWAIILDRNLPDMSPDELLPRLRSLCPEAAVIIVTGYFELEGAIAALREGAADYLIKPLRAEALFKSLERIAERRRLSADKERSDSIFRELVEAAECVIIMLSADLRILYFSPFAERLTGHAKEDVLADRFPERFVCEAERSAVEAMLRRALEGKPARGLEHRIVKRDGSHAWLAWSARRLPDYDGSPAILLVGLDVSDLHEVQRRAVQSERLAAIGEMVTGLAHESRNALQRSQACLEMLSLAVRDRPEARKLIVRLQDAQDHLHRLYEDVRGYAAPIRLETKVCDLRDVWRRAWDHLESHRADGKAELRESGSASAAVTTADPFRIEQVFHNIMENALAATAGEAVISIDVQPSEMNGRKQLCIRIRDNGPGLSAEQAKRAFEPFYTTKAKGTGLGLAITKRIVEDHGGTIKLGSGSPGAEFILTLPLTRSTP